MTFKARMTMMPPVEMRTAIRRVINLGALIRDFPAIDVRVTDLSRKGCRLAGGHGLEPGADIWLKLSGLSVINARVEWVSDEEAGCRFEPPIHQSSVDEAVAAERRLTKGAFGVPRRDPPSASAE